MIAAALGYDDLSDLADEQIEEIKQAHLLLVMYNAFQPGVFALSGWDLVGALPLPLEDVKHLTGDGDTRWINRGGYDLMGIVPDAETAASGGLPRARALYGSIPEQLTDPDSFASHLQRLLAVRKQHQLYAARQIDVPDVTSPGLLILVHELPDGLDIQVTALNFGAEPVEEIVELGQTTPGQVIDMITEEIYGHVDGEGRLMIGLGGREGRSLLIT